MVFCKVRKKQVAKHCGKCYGKSKSKTMLGEVKRSMLDDCRPMV